jgi:hypothetical protein
METNQEKGRTVEIPCILLYYSLVVSVPTAMHGATLLQEIDESGHDDEYEVA